MSTTMPVSGVPGGLPMCAVTSVDEALVMTDALASPERVAALESLAADGPDLVSAAYLLASDIFQEFGWAEAAQLTRDGRVRLRYWRRDWQPRVARWVAEAGIIATEDVLPG